MSSSGTYPDILAKSYGTGDTIKGITIQGNTFINSGYNANYAIDLITNNGAGSISYVDIEGNDFSQITNHNVLGGYSDSIANLLVSSQNGYCLTYTLTNIANSTANSFSFGNYNEPSDPITSVLPQFSSPTAVAYWSWSANSTQVTIGPITFAGTPPASISLVTVTVQTIPSIAEPLGYTS